MYSVLLLSRKACKVVNYCFFKRVLTQKVLGFASVILLYSTYYNASFVDIRKTLSCNLPLSIITSSDDKASNKILLFLKAVSISVEKVIVIKVMLILEDFQLLLS